MNYKYDEGTNIDELMLEKKEDASEYMTKPSMFLQYEEFFEMVGGYVTTINKCFNENDQNGLLSALEELNQFHSEEISDYYKNKNLIQAYLDSHVIQNLFDILFTPGEIDIFTMERTNLINYNILAFFVFISAYSNYLSVLLYNLCFFDHVKYQINSLNQDHLKLSLVILTNIFFDANNASLYTLNKKGVCQFLFNVITKIGFQAITLEIVNEDVQIIASHALYIYFLRAANFQDNFVEEVATNIALMMNSIPEGSAFFLLQTLDNLCSRRDVDPSFIFNASDDGLCLMDQLMPTMISEDPKFAKLSLSIISHFLLSKKPTNELKSEVIDAIKWGDILERIIGAPTNTEATPKAIDLIYNATLLGEDTSRFLLERNVYHTLILGVDEFSFSNMIIAAHTIMLFAGNAPYDMIQQLFEIGILNFLTKIIAGDNQDLIHEAIHSLDIVTFKMSAEYSEQMKSNAAEIGLADTLMDIDEENVGEVEEMIKAILGRLE